MADVGSIHGRSEGVDPEFRCDAGHSNGYPCKQPATERHGRLALCADHVEILDTGREVTAEQEALNQADRWLSESLDMPDHFRTVALTVYVQGERRLWEAQDAHKQYLQRAGDA